MSVLLPKFDANTIRTIAGLMDRDSCVVVGGAALVLHGQIESCDRVGLLVTQEVWDHCAANAWVRRRGGRTPALTLGLISITRDISISSDPHPSPYSYEAVAAQAIEVEGGVRVIPLDLIRLTQPTAEERPS